jgi:hypothetical protein
VQATRLRNPRAEAAERIGHRWDVRVLEPSPPAVTDGPYFADDPVAGGEVVPVDREGARSWAQLCEEATSDPTLSPWCEDRWLVRRPLLPLPDSFVTTRVALQAVAEHVLAPARSQATGKIGLRYTYHGFGTPFFAESRQLRIEDGLLLDQSGREGELTSMAAATRFAGLTPSHSEYHYKPTTPLDLGAALSVDPDAAVALGEWFGFCASLLEQVRADGGNRDDPERVQLWPEHFDLAVSLGSEGARANFGGSPGDADHPEPYLYVGPYQPRTGGFWNESFGASLSYADILAGADPLAFLRHGKELLVDGRQ